VNTAEHTDALTRRIEQLAAAALDEGDGAALAAMLAALRSEIGAVRVDVGSLRSETGGLRTGLDGLEGRLVASVDAGKRETTALLRRFAGELDETVTAAMDETARASAVTGGSLDDARGALESRLAVLEDALDGLSERLEALARDGAVTTTTSLQGLAVAVRDLDLRWTAQNAQSGEAIVGRLGDLLETRLTAVEQRMTGLLDAARERAEQDRAAAERLAATAESRLSALEQGLDRTLTELRATVADQQASVASLTGRFADLGDRLADRLAELSTVVDSTTSRLSSDMTERLQLLEGVMGRFRLEWPTRTFEVVQGARAVAEGVTREVRAEVEVQLERVRAELAGTTQRIDDARDGLDAQSARLAEAGKVLVRYLEQRDRMLEAERDRGLHDVLDSFAAGLSSRERSALASRLGDAVARRRDARDGERYRAGVTAGPQDGPRSGLPPEFELLEADTVVRGLTGRTPRTGSAGPPAGTPERRRSVHPPSASRGGLTSGTSVVPPPAQLRPQPATVSPVRAVPARGRPASITPAPLKRPAGAPGAPGGRPAPAKGAAAPPARKGAASPTTASRSAPRRATPAEAGPSRAASDKRARLEAMPLGPSVDVALDLDPEDRRPAGPGDPAPQPLPPELVGVIPVVADSEPTPPQTTPQTPSPAPDPPAAAPPAPARPVPAPPVPAPDGGSALFARGPVRAAEPAAQDVPSIAAADRRGSSEPQPDEDDGVRRLFRRRPRP